MLYRDTAGNVWTGDNVTKYFNTGRDKTTIANISGTDDPALYQSERWDQKSEDEMTYEIPVESNGSYDVVLHFAEIFDSAQQPDARKFNVYIEKTLVLEEYDIFALVGGFAAVTESFTTTVTDGSLTIDFVRGSIQNPKISAIEIHPAAPSMSNAPSISAAPSISSAPSASPATSASPSSEPSSRPSLRPTRRPTNKPDETTTAALEATTSIEAATTTDDLETTVAAEEATTTMAEADPETTVAAEEATTAEADPETTTPIE